MKKNSSKTNKEKDVVVEDKETHGKIILNKKIIIVTSLVLIIILITTLAIGILNKKQNTTILEAKKTEFHLQDNERMHIELDASGDKVPVPDPSKMYGTDANGKKWGKIYNFTSGTSSDPLFDEVTGAYPLDWSESNGIMRIKYKTAYREPDFVKGDDYDSRLKTLGIEAKSTQEFLSQVENEFNRMLASVEKYGGFYIGRYETGNLSKKNVVVQKGNGDMGSQIWYTMYKKCKNLKGKNTNVETGIAWGNQFDRTLAWLVETGNKTKQEITDDSTSWGNYKNATFEYVNIRGNIATKNKDSSAIIPTGSTEYTKANNIYDLSGNVLDWTMETYYTDYRVHRGGWCDRVGAEYPADYRDEIYPIFSNSLYGCRAMLYIK